METILIGALAGIITAIATLILNTSLSKKTSKEADAVEVDSITKASVATVDLIQRVMATTVEPLRERLVHAEMEISNLRIKVKDQEFALGKAVVLAEKYKMGIMLLSNQVLELGGVPVFFLEENTQHHEIRVQTSIGAVSSTTVQSSDG